MEAIYIPRLLKAPKKTQTLTVEEFLPNFATLTPIRGDLKVTHGGSFLEISTQVETIVNLTCDRCLQRYNHRLAIAVNELIWLDKDHGLFQEFPERELSREDLSESLPADGYFHPGEWLYEQLNLSLPLRQICREDCQQPVALEREPLQDSRWTALSALKDKLPQ